MNNYEYIIASLPVLSSDWKISKGIDYEGIISMIRSQCSKKDNSLIDILTGGFDEQRLGPEFYEEALSSRCGFIKEFFTYDLKVRNAKVRYLNAQLGRPADQDIFSDPKCTPEETAQMDGVFMTNDILEREKGIDNLLWDKIDSMVIFNYFDINVILAFIAKLSIITRWLKLDEATGREMFRTLVQEVRGTFKGVEYDE